MIAHFDNFPPLHLRHNNYLHANIIKYFLANMPGETIHRVLILGWDDTTSTTLAEGEDEPIAGSGLDGVEDQVSLTMKCNGAREN